MTSLYAPSRTLPTLPRTVAPITPPVSRVRRWFRDPAWPLKAVMFGFPLFWVLGLGEFGWPIMAFPMAYQLWRMRRPIKVPPYFGIWLALMAWVLAGGLLIGQHLAGTLIGSGGFTGWGLRVFDMVAVTILLLYVGNLTEEELPTQGHPADGLPVRGDRAGRPARRGDRQRVVLLAVRAAAAARRALELLRQAAGAPGLRAGAGRAGAHLAAAEGAVRLHQQLGKQPLAAADLVRRRLVGTGTRAARSSCSRSAPSRPSRSSTR